MKRPMSAKKRRFIYAVSIVAVILMGLLSRKISAVPLMVGDLLWAVMMFILIRFLLINEHRKVVFMLSLMVCYLVEISQLYHAGWIDKIRNTLIGSLVLGHGFLWSDLFAYTLGICLAALTERLLVPRGHLLTDQAN